MIDLNESIGVTNYRENYKNLKNEKVVYLFVYGENTQRLIGKSAVLKIGETLNFK